MKVIVAKNSGFCFGVKRAITLINKALETSENIYSLGPIIHNPQVVEDLRQKGIQTVESISQIPDDSTVVIRSHGVTKGEYEKALERKINIVDATCPFVKKPQRYLEAHNGEKFLQIIVGKPNHPEVVGIKSYGENTIVLDPEDGFDNIDEKIIKKNKTFYDDINKTIKIRKAVIVSQTTLKIEDFQKMISVIMPIVEELRIYNTICNATRNNQKETKAIASKVDVMIVVGGKNSSNTNKLYNISKYIVDRAYFVETDDEINPKMVDNADVIGITAGASTPDWIIDKVKNKILDIKKPREVKLT